jgi:hypothetical protein
LRIAILRWRLDNVTTLLISCPSRTITLAANGAAASDKWVVETRVRVVVPAENAGNSKRGMRMRCGCSDSVRQLLVSKRMRVRNAWVRLRGAMQPNSLAVAVAVAEAVAVAVA